MTSAETTSTILIVDDIPENLGVLFDFLSQNKFEVLVAEDGESALRLLEYARPQIILLDVLMPSIDGFETCRRLKANSDTQDIPIIFMTALSDTTDKVKGLELGGVDYITKPIQKEEVLARINTHLTIYRLQQELQAKNTVLYQQNAELDAFSHTVAHDLKNPLGAIIGLADVLLHVQNKGLNPTQLKCIETILNSGQKMLDIINALMLLSRVSKQEVFMTDLDMKTIVAQARERCGLLLEKYQGEIHAPNQWPAVVGYPQWVEEIWVNYLSNAIKYGGQPPVIEIGSEEITENNRTSLTVNPSRKFIRFWVRDNGSGLDPEAQAKLFTPFTRLHQHSRTEGHGLGLSIVQRIAEKLGGHVGVKSELGNGSTFYFTLPANQ